ncbi:MAG: AAA family ATPase [Pseudomonadota bacterium]
MQDQSTAPNATREHTPPAWYEELSTGVTIRSHFVLSGNVRDLYPAAGPEGVTFLSFEATLWHILRRRRVGALLVHDPVDGLRLHEGCDARYGEVLAKCGITLGERAETPATLAALATKVARESRLSLALMVDYASALMRTSAAQADALFVAMDQLSRGKPQARPQKGWDWPPQNPVFWVVERSGDVPEWFSTGNPGLRDLIIGMPDLSDRATFLDKITEDLPSDSEAGERAKRIEQVAVQCDGMQLKDLERIARLARTAGRGIEGLGEALRSYLIGTARDPWTSPVMRSRVKGAKPLIEQRVKGQHRAVERTYDILVRSIMGLSGAHTTRKGGRPRGLLFFVGPTGTGKTELAKAVTEVLFGDETAMQRFDMSEFMNEQSIARLIGAPPGAPGHEDGGELVNAVRERPFSVFLFDEVEKGHPRILDAFLQILDDGRLTDSRGETGYFSEALIIFTSNVGMQGADKSSNAGQVILPSDSPDMVERKLIDAVSHHFKTELRRPELMNRIGQNIVPFEFINPRSATSIFDGVLDRVTAAVEEMHGVAVRLEDLAHDQLLDLCTTELNDGGRGIGNRIETYFINPLARFLFQHETQGELVIAELRDEGGDIVLVPAEKEQASAKKAPAKEASDNGAAKKPPAKNAAATSKAG